MALDRGILPRPARVEAKKRGFLLYARLLRRRGTSLCLRKKVRSLAPAPEEEEARSLAPVLEGEREDFGPCAWHHSPPPLSVIGVTLFE